ncbi:MAG TPA: hypothetical protein VMF61_00380 [Candidatus Acidoferrales bacterium]|nr:hypothetical protein [Candidatus Acidoferrales bacterium]
MKRPAATLCLAVLACAWTGQPAPACDGPAYRQFDFWIGRWNVYDRAGRLVGTDDVRKILDGCVVIERYTNAPSEGSSAGLGLSGYQARTGLWYQDFMDDRGLVVRLWGRPRAGAAMEMRGEDDPAAGHRLDRGVWTVRAGIVEELWTVSTDGGKTWHAIFDGYFHKQ